MNKRISIALIFVFALNFIIMDATRVTALTAKPTPERLEAPSEITLAVGESVPVTATLYYSDGSTFDAAKNGIFSYGKQIEFSNGIITGKKAGKTTLKIKAYGKIAIINITVTKASKTNDEPSEIKPIRIETPKALTLAVGESVPLTATVYFSDGSTIDVSKGGANYSYNDTILLQGGMIIGQKAGKTSLIISVYGKTAKVNIIVKEPVKEVESLQVPDTINLEVNQTTPVSATIHFSDESSMDVSRNATFTVKNKAIASVSDGLVIAKKGGNTTVTVKSNGKTAIINVVVAQPPTPVRIDTNTDLTINVGETVPLAASVYYSDGSTTDAIPGALYSVGNKKIISVTQGIVTAIKEGNTTFKINSHGIIVTIKVKVIKNSQDDNSNNTGNSGLSSIQTLEPVTVSEGKITKNYTWQYSGLTFKWAVDLPQALLDYNASHKAAVKKYYTNIPGFDKPAYLASLPQTVQNLIWSISNKSNGNETAWAQDSQNMSYTQKLAEKLQAQAIKNGWGKYQTANFVLKFVQSLPNNAGESIPQYAADSLILTNDCDTKSILYCNIMKNMGYQIALVYYKTGVISPTNAHIQAAVALEDSDIPSDAWAGYRTYNGLNYYEAETMNSGHVFDVGTSAGYKATAIYPQ